MRPLNILLVGSDEPVLRQMAQKLTDEGVCVYASHRLVDVFSMAGQKWDFLLIDVDGLNSFMRSLLPALGDSFPNLPMIGVLRRPVADVGRLEEEYGPVLDAYTFETPRPEDLIVSFPQVAAKYLCETGTLRTPGTRPLFN
jgi:hypothetical protein